MGLVQAHPNKCTLIFTVDLSQDGATALHFACLVGRYQVVELLLQAGASVGQKTQVRWETSRVPLVDQW